jgi:hypothetical protein
LNDAEVFAVTQSIRRLLLAIIVLGLVGTATELVLLEHYEDSWQLVPLFFIAATLVVIAVHAVNGSAGTIYVLRILMGFSILAGLLGVGLHYRGNAEFQLEMDATQTAWQIFQKAIHAKAPPALAPGVMAQLGLLGLLYTYRHPALTRGSLDKKDQV